MELRGNRGNEPCLDEDEIALIRRLVALRRNLSTKRLARRFKISEASVVKYANAHRGGPFTEEQLRDLETVGWEYTRACAGRRDE